MKYLLILKFVDIILFPKKEGECFWGRRKTNQTLAGHFFFSSISNRRVGSFSSSFSETTPLLFSPLSFPAPSPSREAGYPHIFCPSDDRFSLALPSSSFFKYLQIKRLANFNFFFQGSSHLNFSGSLEKWTHLIQRILTLPLTGRLC